MLQVVVVLFRSTCLFACFCSWGHEGVMKYFMCASTGLSLYSYISHEMHLSSRIWHGLWKYLCTAELFDNPVKLKSWTIWSWYYWTLNERILFQDFSVLETQIQQIISDLFKIGSKFIDTPLQHYLHNNFPSRRDVIKKCLNLLVAEFFVSFICITFQGCILFIIVFRSNG